MMGVGVRLLVSRAFTCPLNHVVGINGFMRKHDKNL